MEKVTRYGKRQGAYLEKSASGDVPVFDAILFQRFCQDTKHLLPLKRNQNTVFAARHKV